MTDVELKKEFSTDKTWFMYRDPRPAEQRKPSRTVHDRWFYAPDDRLEIRFEAEPSRRWDIWFGDEKLGFSEDEHPEAELGNSIRKAKRSAVDLMTEHLRARASEDEKGPR